LGRRYGRPAEARFLASSPREFFIFVLALI